MITAVDTNILFDILLADSVFGPSSRSLLRLASLEGKLIACDIVYAEVSAYFPSTRQANEVLRRMEIEYSSIDRETALYAGDFWKLYRRQGGKRTRVISDFLVGAHALAQADRLLTRDRGFYRKYFSKLSILAK